MEFLRSLLRVSFGGKTSGGLSKCRQFSQAIIAFEDVIFLSWNVRLYTQFSLNGHLSKTHTWCWSLPFFSHFSVTILPTRREHFSKTDNGHF